MQKNKQNQKKQKVKMWNILTSQSLTDWGHLMSGLSHLEPKENCRQTEITVEQKNFKTCVVGSIFLLSVIMYIIAQLLKVMIKYHFWNKIISNHH